MEIYHYRTINNALKEIDNGTFRYSDNLEVNDPLEGYVKVYWKGDSVAWEGLFRNYICSLCQSIEFCLAGYKYEDIVKNAVMIDIHSFDNEPFGDILRSISDYFIEKDYIKRIINYFDKAKVSCSAKTLCMLLRIMHEIAYSICICKMKEEKRIPNDFNDFVLPTEKCLIDLINAGAGLSSDLHRKDMFEAVATLVEDMIESQLLPGNKKQTKYLSRQQRWLEVRINYPLIYIEKLQDLLYPKGYFVCFSSDNTNSAMWGNYADHHKGVCLIYQTKKVKDKDTLSVKCEMINGKTTNYLDEELIEVKYEYHSIQRNFFESLGRMNMNQIKTWLAPVKGKSSDLLKIYQDKDWGEKYFHDFKEKYCMKLPEWKYEKEYRLLILDMHDEYTKDNRLVKYKAESFVGIIFGIKTSEYDKMRIIKAIERKGKTLNNFIFYQAEFDNEKNEIVVRRKYYSDSIFK